MEPCSITGSTAAACLPASPSARPPPSNALTRSSVRGSIQARAGNVPLNLLLDKPRRLVCQKSAAVEHHLPPCPCAFPRLHLVPSKVVSKNRPEKPSRPSATERVADTSAPPPMADRISGLLGDVLHHILSLLPARDAVRTCVLAHSWRNLWRSAPAVRFAYSTTGSAGGIDAFARFVDGLLRIRRGGPAPLDSCDFDLDVVDLNPRRFGLYKAGNSWIRRVLQLEVRELRFRVSPDLFGEPRFQLDYTPFSSRHLTSLELTGVDGIALDFSGCPALLTLKMEASIVYSTTMGSPSVKHLSIRSCCIFPECRTAMSFPSLVSFEFIENSGNAPILERMPCLETAEVRFDHVNYDRCRYGRLDGCGDDVFCGCCLYYDGHGNSGSGCVFLQGLAEATHLNLSAYPDMYVFNRDLKRCPAFNKLKTLVLSDWFLSTHLSPLIWFLHHTPLMEKFTLRIPKVHKSLMKIEGSYNPLEKSLASSHLQFVEIICEVVDGIVLKVFKVLNANGIPWWKIRIRCSGFSYVY